MVVGRAALAPDVEPARFAAVKSDVLYLIPGAEDWGLTASDLEQPKFEYLRKIA